MRYKYSDDFFNAITKVLLANESVISFNQLYKESVELLRQTKFYASNYTPSRTQFGLHLVKMIHDRYVDKIEDKNSKLKIKPVKYSLTEKGVREYQFDILTNEKRRKLYQFLFLFQLFNPEKKISAKRFDEILSNIPMRISDIHSDHEGFFHLPFSISESERLFNRPLERLGPTKRLSIVEHIAFSVVHKLKGKVDYYCKLLSFSSKDIMEYEKKTRDKHQEGILIDLPFLGEITFTETELKKELGILRETNLIKPIRNVFDPKADVRFVLSDDSLSEMIYKIWAIFVTQLDLVLLKANYIKKPRDDEREWLSRIFGNKTADKIIRVAYESRESVEEKDKNIILNYVNNVVAGKEMLISSSIEILNKHYSKIIHDKAFPADLIEEICHTPIFPHSN